MKHPGKKVASFLITIFFLTSLQVILVPSCCLFCVLSNDMLNVSVGTFSWTIHAPTSRSLKKSAPRI